MSESAFSFDGTRGQRLAIGPERRFSRCPPREALQDTLAECGFVGRMNRFIHRLRDRLRIGRIAIPGKVAEILSSESSIGSDHVATQCGCLEGDQTRGLVPTRHNVDARPLIQSDEIRLRSLRDELDVPTCLLEALLIVFLVVRVRRTGQDEAVRAVTQSPDQTELILVGLKATNVQDILIPGLCRS
jgi:hypothetical protein